jgi:cyclopropane-fatty-acyl-phospholipid synthase
LLKPDGLMLLQAITIDERRHGAAAREEDFIQRYVFPGGSLPSLSRLMRLLGRHTALRVEHCEDLAPHYALTLRHWRQRFMARQAQAQALGYPPRFVRSWEFYLAYCEAGFSGRAVGVQQLLLAGPWWVPSSPSDLSNRRQQGGKASADCLDFEAHSGSIQRKSREI